MDASAQRFRRDLEALGSPVPQPIGLAVSGGPDSLALLLLAHAAFPGEVRAATVDHGLRAGSAAEAEAVARICGGLGIPHRTLRATVEPRGEGVQAAARAARYAALVAWMRAGDIPLLLTAHHADDQAETLLMRLLRGSGVAGLAGIRASSALPTGRLRRPLLGWRRAELAAIVERAGIEAADDPTNRDDAYDRARLRIRLAQAPWLDPQPLARSAALLAEAEEALDWAAERLAAERIAGSEGEATLDPSGMPSELVRRLVLACLRRVDPAAAPRGEALARAVGSLAAGETITLAGVKARGGPVWRFGPAPPRRPVRPGRAPG
jgi:tRNA(Ile)-lysidine synthase